jgi:hypothetical protein
MIRTVSLLLSLPLAMGAAVAAAQDVPGIEVCTAEKSMERRTSCLQSNIDFLKRSATQAALDQQAKLDAANRAIAALKGQVQGLEEAVAALKKSADQARPQPAAAPAATKPTVAPSK